MVELLLQTGWFISLVFFSFRYISVYLSFTSISFSSLYYSLSLSFSLFYLPVVTSIFLLKDLDKTQTEIMRHHTSISELKRSFMESVPEPQPSEWDKRLSTNSPFRTASINGQFQPAVSPATWGQNTLQTHCFLLRKAGFSSIDFIWWLIQLCRLILCVVNQWLIV